MSCNRLDVNTNYQIHEKKINRVTSGTALFITIQNGDYDNTNCLLECSNFDVNSKLIITYVKKAFEADTIYNEQKPALIYAIENNNKEIIQLLLSCRRLDINQKVFFV